MLQSTENGPKPQYTAPTLNPAQPVKLVTAPIEQATIGRTVLIKGEISGNESLYIDGSVEDGGMLRGSVQLTPADQKHDKASSQESGKAAAAAAGKGY